MRNAPQVLEQTEELRSTVSLKGKALPFDTQALFSYTHLCSEGRN